MLFYTNDIISMSRSTYPVTGASGAGRQRGRAAGTRGRNQGGARPALQKGRTANCNITMYNNVARMGKNRPAKRRAGGGRQRASQGRKVRSSRAGRAEQYTAEALRGLKEGLLPGCRLRGSNRKTWPDGLTVGESFDLKVPGTSKLASGGIWKWAKLAALLLAPLLPVAYLHLLNG